MSSVALIADRGMSEAEARGRRAARATLTFEDRQIFQRRLNRLLEECLNHGRTREEMRGIVQRWMRDQAVPA